MSYMKQSEMKKLSAPFLSVKDTATVTGLSQFFLRKGCKDGTIPHIRNGNNILVNVPLLIERLNRESEVQK